MNRILHVVGKMNLAGAETMIMNIYRNIDLKKVQFDFLYFTDEKSSYDNEIEALGGRIFRLKDSNIILNIFRLKKILRQNSDITAIHCHTALSSFAYLFSAYISNLGTRIIHSHSSKSREEISFTYGLYEKFAKVLINKFANQFISCGELASEYLYPYKKNTEITVIPNAVDVDAFYKTGKEHQDYLRKQYNISEETIVLLQVGRFLTVKNHKFSVEFSKFLCENNILHKLFFAGEGPLKSEIENYVKTEMLHDNIIFLGNRSDIDFLMAGADVLLMPSLHEGFPLVLVEAQSAGLYSIVSGNISKEVDLGLGLLEFENLETDKWLKSLLNRNNSNRLEDEERFIRISNQGFNINESTENILKIYQANG